MQDRNKAVGIALIVVGGLFLAGWVIDLNVIDWPLFVMLPGLLLLGAALFGNHESASSAVPGAIVTTIGLILTFMNATGRWEAWAYCWALLIAAGGFGNYLYGTLIGDAQRQREGVKAATTALGMFAVFGFFFQFFVFGGPSDAMRWLLPLAIIAAGVVLLFFRDQLPLPWFTQEGAGAQLGFGPFGAQAAAPSGHQPAGTPSGHQQAGTPGGHQQAGTPGGHQQASSPSGRQAAGGPGAAPSDAGAATPNRSPSQEDAGR